MAKKFEFNANGFGEPEKTFETNNEPVVQAAQAGSNVVLDIPIELIEIGDNIRNIDANDELALSELGESIKQYGQIEPCVVYQKGEKYVIKCGSRRFKACLEANVPTLRCIVEEDFGDEKERIIRQAIENEQRKDMSPSEREKYMASLLKLGMNQLEIAKALHKGKGWVCEALKAYTIRQKNKDLFSGLKEEPCTRDVYKIGKLKKIEFEKVIEEAKEHGGTRREFRRALVKAAESKIRVIKIRYRIDELSKNVRVDLDMDATELDYMLAEHLKDYYKDLGYTIYEKDLDGKSTPIN